MRKILDLRRYANGGAGFFRSRQDGFGLMSVMVAMVVFAFMSAALVQMVQKSSLSMQSMTSIGSRKDLESYIRMVLRDREASAHTVNANAKLGTYLANRCPASAWGNLELHDANNNVVPRRYYKRDFSAASASDWTFSVTMKWSCSAGIFQALIDTEYRNLRLPGYKGTSGTLRSQVPLDPGIWKAPSSSPEDAHDKSYLEFYPTGNFKALGGDVRLKATLLYKDAAYTHQLNLCGTVYTIAQPSIRTPQVIAAKKIDEDTTCRVTVTYIYNGAVLETHDLLNWRSQFSKIGQNLWRLTLEDADDYDWEDSVWLITGEPQEK